MNDKKDLLNNFLNDTKNQIAAFDQKAEIMLMVVGIMFALITYFCSIFNSDSFKSGEVLLQVLYIVFFILFCSFALFSLVWFILVIVPRKKPKDYVSKTNSKKHINYYMDGASLDNKEFEKLLNDYLADDSVLIQQIINNDRICKRKHICLLVGIIGLIPFAILTFLMILFIIFVF